MRGAAPTMSAAVCCAATLLPAAALSQEIAAPVGGMSPVVTAAFLALLGLLPFVLVVTTSFTKIAVVLSILRSALGTQNVPPNVVLAALAVLLTGFVMAPVATQQLAAVEPLFAAGAPPLDDFAAWRAIVDAIVQPLSVFLAANASPAEVELFASLRGIDVPPEPASLPLWVLAPAFTLTELTEAFQIGFLLFLPFLVLDLLIGAILLSLGMHMLSPTAVSMPFKLLLFVLVNGWISLSHSLVLGYAYS